MSDGFMSTARSCSLWWSWSTGRKSRWKAAQLRSSEHWRCGTTSVYISRTKSMSLALEVIDRHRRRRPAIYKRYNSRGEVS